MLISSIKNGLDELINLLKQLSDPEYKNACADLSGASVGKHSRHIIEMFECLNENYDLGIVNYDHRERNLQIENNKKVAIDHLLSIQKNLNKENKNLVLKQFIEGEEIIVQSNYFRELLYNFEHCIHHQALIKVAVLKLKHITINRNFGVAHSTIEYRNQCAQ